jgi:hypothetical protein
MLEESHIKHTNHLKIQVFWDMMLYQLVNITDVWEVPPLSIFRMYTAIMKAAISSKRSLTFKGQAGHCPIQCMSFSTKTENTAPQWAVN